MGTPVRAPAAGKVRISNGGLGGLSVYVIEPDGTYYYLAHLAATELRRDRDVAAPSSASHTDVVLRAWLAPLVPPALAPFFD